MKTEKQPEMEPVQQQEPEMEPEPEEAKEQAKGGDPPLAAAPWCGRELTVMQMAVRWRCRWRCR